MSSCKEGGMYIRRGEDPTFGPKALQTMPPRLYVHWYKE